MMPKNNIEFWKRKLKKDRGYLKTLRFILAKTKNGKNIFFIQMHLQKQDASLR